MGVVTELCSQSTSAFSTSRAQLALPQTEVLPRCPNPDLNGNQTWPLRALPGADTSTLTSSFLEALLSLEMSHTAPR